MKATTLATYYSLIITAGLFSSLIPLPPSACADPLPFDLPAPPPSINVGLFYNIYSTASSSYTSDGTKIGNTRIATDVPIFRAIKGARIFGMTAAAQIIVPYAAFVGTQEIGGRHLTHNSGFAEPQIGGYIYPINNPSSDQYLVLSYLFSPPSGSYNQNASLNASSNNWINQITVGYGHVILGHAHSGRRLDLQLWAIGNFYTDNNNFGFLRTPFGARRARLSTQPSEKLIIYLPYVFDPRTDAYAGISFSQTFGGKQTIAYGQFPEESADTGNRTDVTTVGIFAGSFISRTMFAYGGLTTDVRSRGGPRNDISFTFVLGRVF